MLGLAFDPCAAPLLATADKSKILFGTADSMEESVLERVLYNTWAKKRPSDAVEIDCCRIANSVRDLHARLRSTCTRTTHPCTSHR